MSNANLPDGDVRDEASPQLWNAPVETSDRQPPGGALVGDVAVAGAGDFRCPSGRGINEWTADDYSTFASQGGFMSIEYPSLDERLRSELESWLCCALADVLALPTESSLVRHDRVGVLRAVARTRRSINEVLCRVSECQDSSQSRAVSPHTLALAEVATTLCRLLEEEVQIVQDIAMTSTR